MTIGEVIRTVRKQKGMTQKKLGENCGIAEPTIRKYESGRLNPKISTLQKIAGGLGVTLSELLGFDPADNEKLERLAAAYPGNEIWTDESGNSHMDITPPDEETLLLRNFRLLNDTGKQKANEYVSDLSEQEKYTK